MSVNMVHIDIKITNQNHYNNYYVSTQSRDNLLQSSHPEFVAKLLESFYVDDLVCGGNNEE